jgi:hypothetical protein
MPASSGSIDFRCAAKLLLMDGSGKAGVAHGGVIGEALLVGSQADLAALRAANPDLRNELAVLVVDDQLGVAADAFREWVGQGCAIVSLGHSAGAMAEAPWLAALRPRAEALAADLAALLPRLDLLAGHRLSPETVATCLVDRVRSSLSRCIDIAAVCQAAAARRLRLLSPRSLPAAARMLVEAAGVAVAEARPAGSPPRLSLLAGFTPLPRPSAPAALAGLGDAPADLYITSGASDLYLASVLPVLVRTVEHRPALLLMPRLGDAEALAGRWGLRPAVQERRLVMLEREAVAGPGPAIGPPASVRDLRDALEAFAAMPDDQSGAALRRLLAEGAARRLLPVLHFAAALQRDFAPLLPRLSSIVVGPGRLTEAAALVDLGNAAAVPTIDIQVGPISGQRAMPPNAARLCCIDEVSRQTYLRDLGVAPGRLLVTGSPRIEHLLAPLRAVSRRRARTLLGALLLPERPRLLLLATQPIGLALCGQILRVVLRACAGLPDIQVLVRMHPAEGGHYLAQYRDLIAPHGFAAISPPAVDPYRLLRACDWLVTYSSTMGLEALVLGTPVIVVNPLPTRPPYDLAAGGGITEVVDEAGLAQALMRAPRRRGRRLAGTAPTARIADLILLPNGQAP